MVSRLEAERCMDAAVKLIEKMAAEVVNPPPNRSTTSVAKDEAELQAMGLFLARGAIECLFRIADAFEDIADVQRQRYNRDVSQ